MLRRWEDLPVFMQTPEVRPYWDSLNKKHTQLFFKRILDIILSVVLLVVLLFPMLFISIWIKADSDGPVFYRQERVTAYGKHFYIHKFRTMVNNADKLGTSITVSQDKRITRVGSKLRRLRLDELPQLFDVLRGSMTFVGTRPEVVKYVEQYLPEYNATLLLPAGITSEASIRYKNEDTLLNNAKDVDQIYIDEVLPGKMKWNLKYLMEFSLIKELNVLFQTIGAVTKKA